jgi:hypothetical protein
MASSILDGIMFEESGTIPEESPVNDEETWDDEDEMLHGRDDTGPIDSGDDEEEPEEPRKTGHFIPPPLVEQAERAFHDLGNILKPCRKKGSGFEDPGLDRFVTEWLSGMKLLCYNYAEMQKAKPDSSQWGAASLHTANSLGSNIYMARAL